jgi:hypothetical protein
LTLDPGGEMPTLRLEGELGIGEARELKRMLAGALCMPLRVDAARTTAWDVTIYQLLWAALREAKRTGVVLCIDVPLADTILLAMAAAGLKPLTAVLQ